MSDNDKDVRVKILRDGGNNDGANIVDDIVSSIITQIVLIDQMQ